MAPSIYGHDNIKRALALSMFGGEPKNPGMLVELLRLFNAGVWCSIECFVFLNIDCGSVESGSPDSPFDRGQ